MKKSINLIFQVHQPNYLRQYRFFDIGNDPYYCNDYVNQTNTEWLARVCYLPAGSMLLRKIVQLKGALKVTFYISGIAIELFQKYAPSVIESFKRLAETGYVEFLCGTWSNSLASIKNQDAFKDQIVKHKVTVQELFGQVSSTFCNAELLYSDDIGALLSELGFKATIAEGAKPVLGWRSPNMLYSNAIYPDFKLLMRNRKICDEIMSCLGETDRELFRTMPSRLVSQLEKTEQAEQVTNLFFDYALLGAVHPPETGVFTFVETFLTAIAQSEHLQFTTPSESAKTYPPASLVSVPHPVSWAGDDRDIAAWTGNDLQQEALNQLYSLTPRILECNHQGLKNDWYILQASDYFYYMSTLFYDKELTNRPNPHKTAHEAFVNYMNIVSDIKLRLQKICPADGTDVELLNLKQQISVCKEKLLKLQKQKK